MPAEAEQETGTPGAEAGAPLADEAAPPSDGESPGAAPAPEGGGDAAVDDVEALRAEAEDYRARWMRAVADYQNLRRRSAEQRAELRMQLLAELVRGYLGVLDDLDRALGSIEQHEELAGHPWVSGVEMVRQKFATLLEGSGVTEIPAEGEHFDPSRHEAVGYQPGPEGRVVTVTERGFEAGSHVVRPARVVVGDGSVAPDDPRDDPAKASGDAGPGREEEPAAPEGGGG